MKDRFGLRELPRDNRDYRLGLVLSLPNLSDIPDEFEIEPYEVFNQEGNDMCAAVTQAGQKAIMEQKRPFYPALFAISKQITGDPDEWGQNQRDMEKAATISVPMWEDTPDFLIKKYEEGDWDFLRRIENYPQDYIDSGKKYRNVSFFKVWSPKYDAYDTCRAALWKFKDKKQTIGFGVNFSWNMSQERLTGTSMNGFGHRMLMNGSSVTKDGLIVTNSYGKQAGKNGQHIISRETINFFADKYGIFMATDIPQETAKEQNKRAEWYQAGFFAKLIILIKRLWK